LTMIVIVKIAAP